jgi:ankyrin repeat protein
MRAAKTGDAAVARILLEAGADPGRAQKNGSTAVMLAAGMAGNRGGNNPDRGAEEGALQVIRLCLDRGADVNAVSTTGDTAVHAAVTSPAIIRLLAERGARLDVRNAQGRTPLDVALRAREPNQEAVALLRRLTE